MTYPRRQLVVPGHADTYHCVARCVRRAWLCGVDSYTGKCFEHRKAWIESRIQHLGRIFAMGIHTYAVMSNHLHIVLHVAPNEADTWSDSDIANRWLLLYPPKPQDFAGRHAELCEDAERLKVLRIRLGSLSWFMSCLNEHIARLANAEDQCTGRFWEGRFRCQALLSEHAVLAACAYVDLNPIRAGIAQRVTTSVHTGVRLRALALKQDPQAANLSMRPLAGLISANFPRISTADYIELVDWTGRQLHLGKRGVIEATEPPALRLLGLDPGHWTMKVKGIGNGYWRAVGTVQELLLKAEAMRQKWLCGIGFARLLKG